MRNNYSRYVKFLNGTGPALKERFDAGGQPPIMSIQKFKDEINIVVQKDPHKQKDLRQLTHEVLSDKSKTKKTSITT